jgi:hypothetical protein
MNTITLFTLSVFIALILNIVIIAMYRDKIVNIFKTHMQLNIVFILLFIIVIFLSVISTIPSKKEKQRDNTILQMKPINVTYIILSPTYKKPSLNKLNVTNNQIIVKDKNIISEICYAINNSKIILPNHPSCKWECDISLSIKNDKFSQETFNVSSTDQGVILYLNGRYRSDKLGQIIEDIVKTSEDAANPTPVGNQIIEQQ